MRLYDARDVAAAEAARREADEAAAAARRAGAQPGDGSEHDERAAAAVGRWQALVAAANLNADEAGRIADEMGESEAFDALPAC